MAEPILIIGGGPAGTASAMNLLRVGLDPTIVEAETFPRFHIGESLTTECVDALNRLGLKRELSNLGAPKKAGVRIFSSHPDNSFYVGAGDAWQVERSHFDKMMLDVAISRGANFIPGRAVGLTKKHDDWSLTIRRPDGTTIDRRARFVVDASGQRRFSHRQGLFSPLIHGNYAHQIALFSQYTDVNQKESDKFDTLIFHRATHEWCWMIPLSETVTSIGLVTPVHAYKKAKLPAADYIESNFAGFSDPFDIRFKGASRIMPVQPVSNYSFQIDEYASGGLYCVGDSHRFIDPIFSFGVEFAVLEAEYLGRAIRACVEIVPSEWARQEQSYMQITTSAQDTIGDMLSYFWAHPWGFANMAHVRYVDEFLELFAGRIYETEAGEGLRKMRATMA